MNIPSRGTRDQALADLAEVRGQLAAIEERWKLKREESRALTILLITEYGFSVAKASELSGHHRNTIGVWLKVHNAATKNPHTSS